MICHKHKCIFIHVPKTGGTSIEWALQNKKVPIEQKHKTSNEICELHPVAWEQYFKFTVVRNPWDWLVSWYYWRKLVKKMSFKEFLLNYNLSKKYDYLPDVINFTNYLTIDDKLVMDRTCRFENLQHDFPVVCDELNINATLPHKNKTNHKHYTEYYDDETRTIVAEKYAKDIEYFGYRFGE